MALLLVVPSMLISLLYWIMNSQMAFDHIAPSMVGLFPFTVMFLLTSITTLKERRSGTLERSFTMPMRRGEFIAGYAFAFGFLATLQTVVTILVTVELLNMSTVGSATDLYLAGVSNAILGMALGLLASAFAQTEFQVIQFMPAFIFPQVLLGGLLVPITQMPSFLGALSEWLPLTHALTALNVITTGVGSEDFYREISLVVLASVLSLLLGAITLRKKTN